MLKLLGKMIATWLTAFSIAGATVWAASEDDAADADTPGARNDGPQIRVFVDDEAN